MDNEEYSKLKNAVARWVFTKDVYLNKKYDVFGIKPYWFIGLFCILFLWIINNR